jgi:pimeloyl-ACP methyl ester carboxylesterase
MSSNPALLNAAVKARKPIAAPPRLGLVTREFPTFFVMHAKAVFARPVPVPARGHGRKVMLLPGFLASHESMALLYRSLAAADFDVAHWGLGRNMGADAAMLDRIDGEVRRFANGAPVALIGWSLGGLIAREYAKARPDAVRQVITMGSPFSGDIARTTNVARVYQRVTGHAPEHAPFAAGLNAKPPVPTAALWSRRDAVVAPKASRGYNGEVDESIEMQCPHMGFSVCPDTIRTVAALLAR